MTVVLIYKQSIEDDEESKVKGFIASLQDDIYSLDRLRFRVQLQRQMGNEIRNMQSEYDALRDSVDEQKQEIIKEYPGCSE